MIRSIVCVALLALASTQVAAQQRQVPPDLRPAYSLPEGARTLRDVEYARVGEVSLKLDLYLPPGIESAKSRPPLVVWIHGGGWRGGSKNDCPLRWLVGKGYAVASISYRLSTVAKFPAGVHDCKGAIRWLRTHASEYGYNAERIGVSGGSAGGHLVSLLGTTGEVKELEGDVGGNTNESSRVQAVVNFFGPCDFPRLEEQNHPEFVTSLVALWIDSPIVSNRKVAELASPLYHVTSDDAPHLIIQGDKDPLVYVPQVQVLHDAYKKAGLESTLEIIPGGGHGGGPFFDDGRRKMIEQFFDRHVRQTASR